VQALRTPERPVEIMDDLGIFSRFSGFSERGGSDSSGLPLATISPTKPAGEPTAERLLAPRLCVSESGASLFVSRSRVDDSGAA